MLVKEEEAREPPPHPAPRFWSSQSEKGLRKSAFNHMWSKENALDSTEKKTLKSYFCSSTKTMSNLGPLTARITTIVIVYWAHTIFQDLRDSGVFLRAGRGVILGWRMHTQHPSLCWECPSPMSCDSGRTANQTAQYHPPGEMESEENMWLNPSQSGSSSWEPDLSEERLGPRAGAICFSQAESPASVSQDLVV